MSRRCVRLKRHDQFAVRYVGNVFPPNRLKTKRRDRTGEQGWGEAARNGHSHGGHLRDGDVGRRWPSSTAQTDIIGAVADRIPAEQQVLAIAGRAFSGIDRDATTIIPLRMTRALTTTPGICFSHGMAVRRPNSNRSAWHGQVNSFICYARLLSSLYY